jgi:hypothetical protein
VVGLAVNQGCKSLMKLLPVDCDNFVKPLGDGGRRLLAVDARRVATVSVREGDRFGGSMADSTGSSSVLLESRWVGRTSNRWCPHPMGSA